MGYLAQALSSETIAGELFWLNDATKHIRNVQAFLGTCSAHTHTQTQTLAWDARCLATSIIRHMHRHTFTWKRFICRHFTAAFNPYTATIHFVSCAHQPDSGESQCTAERQVYNPRKYFHIVNFQNQPELPKYSWVYYCEKLAHKRTLSCAHIKDFSGVFLLA